MSMTESEAATVDAAVSQPPPVLEWAMVEIMGRRTHYGQVSEVTRYGKIMLRVDEITDQPGGFRTRYYFPSAVFGVTIASEADVRAMADGYDSAEDMRESQTRKAERMAASCGDTDGTSAAASGEQPAVPADLPDLSYTGLAF